MVKYGKRKKVNYFIYFRRKSRFFKSYNRRFCLKTTVLHKKSSKFIKERVFCVEKEFFVRKVCYRHSELMKPVQYVKTQKIGFKDDF